MTQAVVLAGGRGTRLRPLTDTIPKGLVSIGGKPILDHIIRHLAKDGVDDVILALGWLSPSIRRYFETESGLPSIRYIEEPVPLGTGGALREALRMEMLNDEFAVVYGDTWFPEPLKPLQDILSRDTRAFASVWVSNSMFLDQKPNVAVNAVNNTVVEYNDDKLRWRESFPIVHGIEAGTSWVWRSALRWLPSSTPVSFEKTCYPLWVRDDRHLLGLISNVRAMDMGTPERLEFLRRNFGE